MERALAALVERVGIGCRNRHVAGEPELAVPVRQLGLTSGKGLFLPKTARRG